MIFCRTKENLLYSSVFQRLQPGGLHWEKFCESIFCFIRCYESGNWSCDSLLLSLGIHSNVQIYYIPDGQCTMTAAFQRSVFADLETCWENCGKLRVPFFF